MSRKPNADSRGPPSLWGPPPDRVDLLAEIERGLPIKAYERVAHTLALSPDEAGPAASGESSDPGTLGKAPFSLGILQFPTASLALPRILALAEGGAGGAVTTRSVGSASPVSPSEGAGPLEGPSQPMRVPRR